MYYLQCTTLHCKTSNVLLSIFLEVLFLFPNRLSFPKHQKQESKTAFCNSSAEHSGVAQLPCWVCRRSGPAAVCIGIDVVIILRPAVPRHGIVGRHHQTSVWGAQRGGHLGRGKRMRDPPQRDPRDIHFLSSGIVWHPRRRRLAVVSAGEDEGEDDKSNHLCHQQLPSSSIV
jgi:hypothetical protein